MSTLSLSMPDFGPSMVITAVLTDEAKQTPPIAGPDTPKMAATTTTAARQYLEDLQRSQQARLKDAQTQVSDMAASSTKSASSGGDVNKINTKVLDLTIYSTQYKDPVGQVQTLSGLLNSVTGLISSLTTDAGRNAMPSLTQDTLSKLKSLQKLITQNLLAAQQQAQKDITPQAGQLTTTTNRWLLISGGDLYAANDPALNRPTGDLYAACDPAPDCPTGDLYAACDPSLDRPIGDLVKNTMPLYRPLDSMEQKMNLLGGYSCLS
jgi:hypothetical protein